MKQEIEQAVDQMVEQEPSPDQLDLGEPYEFPGELIVGAGEAARDMIINKLATLARKQIGYYWLGEFTDQFAGTDIAIWIGDVGAELPTGEQVVAELIRVRDSRERRR